MIGQKLIKILQTLDPPAFRRLGDAFCSPVFTNSPLLFKLYHLLKKEYPDFDESRLQKEQVFQKLYPGKAFKDGTLRMLVREFAKITEDFLLLEKLRNDKTARQKLLTEWYGEQNLYSEFERGTKAILDEMEAAPFRDVEYYNDKIWLYSTSYFHPDTDKHTLDDQILIDLMDSLDGRFILFKLRLASEMKNRERILSKKYQVRFLNEVMEAGNSDLLSGNIVFNLYGLLIELYEPEKALEAFHLLKGSLEKHIAALRPFDQSLLLTQLINYGVRQLNKGDTGFNKHVFELYQLALNHHLVVVNGKINPVIYRNIVSSGCKEKAFEWTETFIYEFEPFLEAGIRQDSKTGALALLCFHRQDYDGVIDLASKHQFFDLLLQLNTRVILLKSWFEKYRQDRVYYDILISQLDTIEKFIRRNAVISRQKKVEHLNFILATRKLVDFTLSKKPASEIRSRLDKYLNNNQRILSKDWLVSKIEQYESSQ